MFDVLDDLEDAVGKLLASEPNGDDLERVSNLVERMECARLRTVGAFDRSGVWAADRFVSTASAMRAKLRCSQGYALRSIRLANYARDSAPAELRNVVKGMCDAFDGDKGAKDDKEQHALNQVTLSQTTGGRGVLNGSLDAELTDVVLTALDAEMEQLREAGDVRKTPELRSAALESIARQYLASRGDSTARGRGQTHVSVVTDLSQIAALSPELAEIIRAETAHGGMLSRNTLERLTCDCRISRVITDGPSNVLDVGSATRNVSNAQWNALVVRDRHCTAKNCTRPPGFCEAHHKWHWEHGGPTDLWNLELLCWEHHRERHIHDALARAG